MKTLTFEVGEKSVVKLQSIRGDLRLSGRQGGQIEIKAYSDDMDVVQKGDSLTINCPSDCLIFLPSESRIEGDSIGGDVRVTNIRGEVMLRTVGGDLSLRGFGKGVFETIGGNFHARKGTGDVSVDRIGGDGVIEPYVSRLDQTREERLIRSDQQLLPYLDADQAHEFPQRNLSSAKGQQQSQVTL